MMYRPAGKLRVALRKESVDRNDNFNLHCVEEVSSLSARRAWIEIFVCVRCFGYFCRSLSARRAWIEILFRLPKKNSPPVALRKESVDRNSKPAVKKTVSPVALRKESVDRNVDVVPVQYRGQRVALRKESVDRNRGRIRQRDKLQGRSPQGERG